MDADGKPKHRGSGRDLTYRDEVTGERFTPHVIEPSAGADRATLAFLCEAYHEDQAPDDKGDMQTRVVMKFHPRIAPVKAAVFPLVKKDGMPEAAKEIYTALKKRFVVFYDEKGAVGRRYRRQDEAGTPFCITVDGQTLHGQHGHDPRPRFAGAVAREERRTWSKRSRGGVEGVRLSARSRCATRCYQLAVEPRGELIELAFEIREQHLRARAADEVGVERRCAAAAHGGEGVGRVLQLAELGVDFLQLAAGVAAVAPEPRDDEHQAEDERALAGEREASAWFQNSEPPWASDQAIRPRPRGERREADERDEPGDELAEFGAGAISWRRGPMVAARVDDRRSGIARPGRRTSFAAASRRGDCVRGVP